MQRFSISALVLAGVLSAAWSSAASAQSPSPAAAPGAGHGFLIDKHTAAGLKCSACHAEATPSKQPDQAVCTKCHGTYPQIAAKTASDQPNPHASHLGEVACMSCHHVHTASVLSCSQCHNFDLTTP